MLIGTVFVVAAGIYSVAKTPLDAIPDLSDVQVIVYTEYPGQAPQVVEDQVTFPLATAMLAVPHSKVVRGFSLFGVSFVYIIFEDGTDIYWARSRALEYLNFAAGRLPQGLTFPGPRRHRRRLGLPVRGAERQADARRAAHLQDWSIRYALTKARGVSEVASIGGFVKTYAVTVDPLRLEGLRHPAGAGDRGDPAEQHGRRGPRRRDDGDRVRRARPRLPARHGDLEKVVLKAEG